MPPNLGPCLSRYSRMALMAAFTSVGTSLGGTNMAIGFPCLVMVILAAFDSAKKFREMCLASKDPTWCIVPPCKQTRRLDRFRTVRMGAGKYRQLTGHNVLYVQPNLPQNKPLAN